MKKSTFFLLPIILFFGLSLGFTDCKKKNCGGTSIDTASLTATELSSIPYKGLDTLYFLHNQTDTCMLIGKGKVRFYIRGKTQYGFGGNPLESDCPYWEYTDYETHTINFEPVKGDLKLDTRLQMGDKSGFKRDLVVNVPSSGVEFIGGAFVWVGVDSILDVTRINDVDYFKVRVYTSIDYNDTSSIFVNSAQGIVMIRMPNNNYTIIKKP